MIKYKAIDEGLFRWNSESNSAAKTNKVPSFYTNGWISFCFSNYLILKETKKKKEKKVTLKKKLQTYKTERKYSLLSLSFSFLTLLSYKAATLA